MPTSGVYVAGAGKADTLGDFEWRPPLRRPSGAVSQFPSTRRPATFPERDVPTPAARSSRALTRDCGLIRFLELLLPPFRLHRARISRAAMIRVWMNRGALCLDPSSVLLRSTPSPRAARGEGGRRHGRRWGVVGCTDLLTEPRRSVAPGAMPGTHHPSGLAVRHLLPQGAER